MQTNAKPRRKVLWIFFVLVWIAGLAGAIVAYKFSQPGQTAPPALLGEEYRNDRFKVAFRLPADWKRGPMPPGLLEGMASNAALMAEAFEGPRPGDIVIVRRDGDGRFTVVATVTMD